MSRRLLPLGMIALIAGCAADKEQRARTEELHTHQPEMKSEQRTIAGEVAAVEPALVVIRGPDPLPLRLVVDETTQVMVDGQPASARVLTPGTEVRATYTVLQGQPTAVRIVAEDTPDTPPPPIPSPMPEVGLPVPTP